MLSFSQYLTEASRIKWISKRLPNSSNPTMSPDAWVSSDGRFTIRMQTVGGRTSYYLYDKLGYLMPGAEYDTDWRNPLDKYSKRPRNTGSAGTLDAAKRMAEMDLVDPLNRRK